MYIYIYVCVSVCVSLCVYIYICICIYNPITYSFPMAFKVFCDVLSVMKLPKGMIPVAFNQL